MLASDHRLADVSRTGGRYALVDGATHLTAFEIEGMSSRLASALAANGIGRGDRVIVFLDDGWQAIVAMVAVLHVGATFVPVDASATATELAALLNDSGATGLVTQARLVRPAAAAMAAAPALRLTIIAGCEGTPQIDGIMRFEDAVAESPLMPGKSPGDAEPAPGHLPAADSEILADSTTVLGRSFRLFVAAAEQGETLVLRRSERRLDATG